MNIEQATKDVAESLGYMADDAICVENLPEFSRRLIAKLTESAKPVGYLMPHYQEMPHIFMWHPLPAGYSPLMGTKLFTHPAPVPEGWQPIETIPHFQFVWAYCKEAHESLGAASSSNGGMVVCYQPATDRLPAQFIDIFGVLMNWRFTHWMPLPAAPKPEVK